MVLTKTRLLKHDFPVHGNSLILRLFAFVCVCSRLRAFTCVFGPFSESLKSAFGARSFAFSNTPLWLHPLVNEKCAQIFFLHKLFEHPQGSGTSRQKFPGHPRFLSSKSREGKFSREGTNFSATTPSYGRPPPHRAVSIFPLKRSVWGVGKGHFRARKGQMVDSGFQDPKTSWNTDKTRGNVTKPQLALLSGWPQIGLKVAIKHEKRQNFWKAPGTWGRTQMGSDGLNRVLTGFCLLDPVRVRAVPSETHDFKGFRPDFNQILTGF